MKDISCPKYIGGFFELELSNGAENYHKNAMALTNGRACLSLIIEKTNPLKYYVPYYSCDALYEPIKSNCKQEFYSIDNNLEIIDLPELGRDEYLIYINYFGLKNRYVEKLKQKYGSSLIIDETHNFFKAGHKGFWSFTSARKYFGVPDGAYLYSPFEIKKKYERNTEISLEHLTERLLGRQQLAYQKFVAYEKTLGAQVKLISAVSEKLLSCVDYKKVRTARRLNYDFYQDSLSNINIWSFDNGNADPFCYPLLLDEAFNKVLLHENNIFIPTLWPDVLMRGDNNYNVEIEITKKLLPLPVDHRYTPNDLKVVVEKIKEFT